MPLITRNYLSLPDAQRREAAQAARNRIKEALRTPGLTEEQTQRFQLELKKISQWVAGKLGQ